MPEDPSGELISILESRRAFLDALSKGALTQADLARELDVSRSTVTRAVRALEKWNLIARTDSAYEITAFGMTALRSLERYRKTIVALRDASELLRYVPPRAPFDPALLTDGTQYLIETGQSYRIRERVNDVFREATAIEGVSRTRSATESVPIFRRKILEEHCRVEMVLDADLYEHVRSEFDGDGVFERDHVSVSVTESVPYGLFVVDRERTELVVLVVYDEHDAMKGVLFNETARGVSWARETIESMAEEAIPESVATTVY
jgi:predicted transcriptional regulator